MIILQEIHVPQESVNDQSLIVVGLNFGNGDPVKKGNTLIELETSKAVVTIEAETDGYVIYHCKEGDEVLLNSLIIQIADSKPEDISFAAPVLSLSSNEKKITHSARQEKITKTEFSKKAIELLEKKKLSKDIFYEYDFVTEAVIFNYLNPSQGKNVSEVKKPIVEIKPPPLNNVIYQKLSAGKKREIEYLSAVQKDGLVSTLYINIDTRGVINSINKKLSYFKESILTLVVFEAAKLLMKYPLLNSFYEDKQVAQFQAINIGIAIDIDDGLKVVKLPDTKALDIFQIEEKIFELSNKYLDKKLSVNDLSEVTFTITDLSATSVSFFTPLINKNNSAILGIAKIDKQTGNCNLSLSFDHRVTEGKYAGNFLSELKHRIESYSLAEDETLKSLICYKCFKEISEDLNGLGFIKVQTRSGEDKLVCDTCLFKF